MMEGIEDEREKWGSKSKGKKEGESKRNGDGEGEMIVNLEKKKENERKRNEKGEKKEKDRDKRKSKIENGIDGGIEWREFLGGNDELEILKKKDGVVEKDKDGEKKKEKCEKIDREEKKINERKCKDDRDRKRDEGNECWKKVMKEDEKKKKEEDDRIDEGVKKLIDGEIDEIGSIEGDRIVDKGGKDWIKIVNKVMDKINCVERIRERMEIDRDRKGGSKVKVNIKKIDLSEKIEKGKVIKKKSRGIMDRWEKDDIIERGGIRKKEMCGGSIGEGKWVRIGMIEEKERGEMRVMLMNGWGKIDRCKIVMGKIVREKKEENRIIDIEEKMKVK